MAEAAFDDAVVKQPEPGWIGQVLGTTVTSLEARLLGEARGFQSTTWHLQLSCDPPEGGPASVILKSETSDQDFNEFSRLNNAFRITNPPCSPPKPASQAGCCWRISPTCVRAFR